MCRSTLGNRYYSLVSPNFSGIFYSIGPYRAICFLHTSFFLQKNIRSVRLNNGISNFIETLSRKSGIFHFFRRHRLPSIPEYRRKLLRIMHAGMRIGSAPIRTSCLQKFIRDYLFFNRLTDGIYKAVSLHIFTGKQPPNIKSKKPAVTQIICVIADPVISPLLILPHQICRIWILNIQKTVLRQFTFFCGIDP